MPFQNTAAVVEFRYVNDRDPLGEIGLKPRTWNLEPDPERPGHFRLMAPGVPGESVWRFAEHRTQQDEDLMARKVAKTEIKYNRKQARREGANYSPTFEQETLMSGLMALLTTMSRGWEGPEFIVPDGATDANGHPSQYRGKTAPCSPYWIGQRDPVELRAVELFLQNLYEPEAEDDDSRAMFPEADSGVARSNGAGPYPADAGQPGGDIPVSSTH